MKPGRFVLIREMEWCGYGTPTFGTRREGSCGDGSMGRGPEEWREGTIRTFVNFHEILQ